VVPTSLAVGWQWIFNWLAPRDIGDEGGVTVATPGQLLAEGRSQSLRRSIRELREILAGQGVRFTGDLRPVLYRLLRDYGELWYRRGFAVGIEEVGKRDPKAVRKMLPIRARRKVWFLGRRSGLYRSLKLRHK
jgi:hypothetical protein